MHSFNLITCHYDIHVYHHQAYLDSSIPLVKNQVSKSCLQHFYRLWSVCLRRNFLGSSNNGNPTLEAARVFYVMMSLSDVSFRPTKELDKGLMNLSNMMSTIAHGDPCPPPPPNASQERKIAHLNSSGHSGVVAAKMAAIYAEKRKLFFLHGDQPLHYPLVPKTKHIRFMYSDDEDEDNNATPEDVVAQTDASGSPLRSDTSSHYEEF
ncbi:hypothetical protein DVH24_031043 [Malus domestica]|uniref:Uncharacterized protein n=1 Tax=Malus domestica TaxID=3750 RepID=A0A498HD63_MALDO|nr:hypothetical protein DVH24_031043 [Malus domestica]